MPSLADLGEAGLLATLAERGLVSLIEDDVAVLDGGVVVTQDALVEGVHFRREWTGWRDLGYKAAAVNLSDLAAAGAEPEALVVTLAAPPDTALEDVVALYEGMSEAGVPVRGGDTSRAGSVVLSVTAIGRSPRVPGRGGARPGDLLVVTGPLGGSAAGLRALAAGEESPHVETHRRPPLRLAEGRELAATAHALMDISDGLAADVPRLAAASGVRCVVELERIPRPDGVTPEQAAVGGEDYELLAAVEKPGPYTIVGRVEEGEGAVFLRGGAPVELRGFDHFR